MRQVKYAISYPILVISNRYGVAKGDGAMAHKEEVTYEKEFTRQLITQLRQQRGVSARKLSKDVGVNEAYINRIENKISEPSMEVFFKICKYFEITPEVFFAGLYISPDPKANLIHEIVLLEDDKLIANLAGIVEAVNKKL